MGHIVLVTGVSKDLGGGFARRISADPAVNRVIGVDVVPPPADLGDKVSFVQADIRNAVIAKVMTGEDVDTVVHTSVHSSARSLGRAAMKEHNVIGTMQLLAACQRAAGLERLVVKSSAEVYGASSRDPALFSEEMAAKQLPRGAFAKDVLEVEGYVRGFSRRRPDVAVTMIRNASTIASFRSSPMADYLRLNPTPRAAGYDGRLQLLHHDDLVGVLLHSALRGVHGTFNVAGDGFLTISQAIRRLGHVGVPMPPAVMSTLGPVLRHLPVRSRYSPDQVDFLTYGRGIDTTRMRTVLGFQPTYTTAEALAEFATSLPPGGHALLAAGPLVGGLTGGSHG